MHGVHAVRGDAQEASTSTGPRGSPPALVSFPPSPQTSSYKRPPCSCCISLQTPLSLVPQAVAAAAKIGDEEVVIKSQILAGGRGLGTFTNGFKGGVHVIKTSQMAEYAGKMLGGRLVTKQSGPEGKPVDTLLIAKKMHL
eukprot:scaffold16074_cov114-Isochrysis_galbana.AAC.3